MERPWEKEGWVAMVDENHEIHGVTPEQIDWWWDNMEKGYPLWHPVDHHNFFWEVAPGDIGHIGAVQIADQSPERQGGARATWLDLDILPFVPEYNHVLVMSGFSSDAENIDIGVHQYEAADYGTKHRFTVILKGPRAEEIKAGRAAMDRPLWNGMTHFQAEAYCWEQFLPALWKMWQVVKDPRVNPQPNLTVRKLPNGKLEYICDNKPPNSPV